jgi:RNA recognition motif-containing protein
MSGASILRVGNLPGTLTEQEIRKHFSRYGTVLSVTIAKDTVTGVSRRFADIEMSEDEGAAEAVKWLHLSQMDGRTISVMLITASHTIMTS